MSEKISKDWKIKAEDISLIVYDFDGVMTDNTVMVSEDGKESVKVNRSDGLAVSILRDMGVRQLILSREKNPVVSARARKLKLPVLQGITDKESILKKYCRREKIPMSKVLFIGNDINDVGLLRVVGYPLCPRDAYPEARSVSKFIIPTDGGHGVVREMLHHIIK